VWFILYCFNAFHKKLSSPHSNDSFRPWKNDSFSIASETLNIFVMCESLNFRLVSFERVVYILLTKRLRLWAGTSAEGGLGGSIPPPTIKIPEGGYRLNNFHKSEITFFLWQTAVQSRQSPPPLKKFLRTYLGEGCLHSTPTLEKAPKLYRGSLDNRQ
jgi:hypothetical protein